SVNTIFYMRYIVLVLLLKISALISPAQNLQSFNSARHFYGQGKINNSNIFIELDFLFRYAYTKGCITQRYYQISGNYYYEQYGKPIQLIGKLNLDTSGNDFWSEDETVEITLYELSSDYEKRALFKGKISPENFQGDWIDEISSKCLPFHIDWQVSNLGNLKVCWNAQEYLLPTLNNAAYQGEYKLVHQMEKDHKLFLVLLLTIPSCEVYNCKGSGCGGADQYLYWYAIEKQKIEWQCEIVYRETPFLDLTDIQITPDSCVYRSEDLEKNGYQVKIDYRYPEKGIIKTRCNKKTGHFK
ncbi:MAG: hypothetical protein K2L23_03105, partial [Odoribacter sp.]|nr:hypothetical protein [Odoribacter sp.]